ncbi:trypsin-like peptidase domain-containing protein [Microbacterium sp. NPDC056003]|uniref:trypsin-like peptidase domain-containing protein n=1 Tax=Microbacterium sp. NPDC056003 TaxID=3345676 RepID=UPI0035DB876B
MHPDDDVWSVLADATVRIGDDSGRVHGSGVFIAPRRVLTVAHVVARTNDPLVVTTARGDRLAIVRIRSILPKHKEPGSAIWPLPDLALLAVEDEDLPPGLPFVELSDHTPGAEVFVSGSAIGLSGDLVDDRARLRYEATVTDQGYSIHKFTGTAVSPGMSGGPILDPGIGKVVGLVKADRGAERGAYAIAAAAVREALPAEWASHLQAHEPDSEWRRRTRSARHAAADASAVSRYLTALSESTSESGLLPEGVRRRDVRQPTRVRPRRAIGVSLAQDRIEGRNSVAANTGDTFLWDPARSPWKSVGVVAGPGMGKTWLLLDHAVAIAEQSLARLSKEGSHVADAVVPAFVSAAAFARRLAPDADVDEILASLGATLKRALPLSPDQGTLASILGMALDESRLVLCVDGLDEVPVDLRERLRAALAELEPRLAQLIVSGRESARGALERVFVSDHEEFELAGFALGDVQRFVRAWHRRDSVRIRAVEKALRDNPRLRELAHVPLLLTFVCRLAGNHDSLASTRSGLYRDMMNGVLSGAWRDSDPQPTDPATRLALLSDAIGSIAAGWRSPLDEFSRHSLESALRGQPGYQLLADAALDRWRRTEGFIDRQGTPEPVAPVTWEFLHDGVLVESEGSAGERLLRFTHLVFGEFTAATWIASMSADARSHHIEAHRWFDSQWTDTIAIACGIAADCTDILELLFRPLGDPWLSQAELLASCMAEAPATVPPDLVKSLIDFLVERLNRGPASDATTAQRALGALVAGRVTKAVEHLGEALHGGTFQHERHVAFALRTLCQAGEPRAVAACREIVADPSSPTADRDAAARALCSNGDPTSVNIVVRTFSAQRGTHQNLASALASGEGASREAKALVQRDDLDRALKVVVGLEQLRVNGDDALVVELLGDNSIGVANEIVLIEALLRAGRPVDHATANRLIANPNATQRDKMALVHALLLRGDFAALPAAADLVIDTSIDFELRRRLAQTMVSIGREGGKTLCLAATRSFVPVSARLQALLALIEGRNEEGCRAANAIVAEGAGEGWIQGQLAGHLLVHAPSIVDMGSVRRLLADPELAAASTRQTWEDLAGQAMRSADTDLRDALHDRIRRRMANDAGPGNDLRSIDLRRLLRVLSASGRHGLDLVLEIAADNRVPMPLRIEAAMRAVTTDINSVDWLEQLLSSDELSGAVRERLVVAFAMLGAPQMLARIQEMLPTSEPAYAALGAILRGPTIGQATMAEGVLAGTAAAEYLAEATPVTWDVDFASLADSIEFASGSEVQRDSAVRFLENQLRTRTLGRLLSLLLPSELEALYSIDGFVDSDATRNWLAVWVPSYHEVASEELRRLQVAIEADPDFPPPIDTGTSLSIVSNVASLLDEWWKLICAERYVSALNLISANLDVFVSAVAKSVNDVAWALDGWPTDAARNFLLDTVRAEGGVEAARRILSISTGPLDIARHHFSHGEITQAFGAASMGIFLDPTDAAGYFYAAEAMAVNGQQEHARNLMEMAAARASPSQATQGRASLLETGQQFQVPIALIEDLRDILARALPRNAVAIADEEPRQE